MTKEYITFKQETTTGIQYRNTITSSNITCSIEKEIYDQLNEWNTDDDNYARNERRRKTLSLEKKYEHNETLTDFIMSGSTPVDELAISNIFENNVTCYVYENCSEFEQKLYQYLCLEGLTVTEISTLTGIPRSTITSRINKFRSKLKKNFENF